LTTLLTKTVGHEEQGEALGTAQSLASIAQILGQLIAGVLIDRHLLLGYGLAAGAFGLAGVVLSLLPEPEYDGTAAQA
jgi:MFS family permease